MSIKPKCDKCGKELNIFGALLFSPPDKKNNTKKFHICVDCYKEIAVPMRKKNIANMDC